MAARASLHRKARTDAAFDLVLLGFRRGLLAVLDGEPPGPARHLRAYVACVCELARRRHRSQRTAARLLWQAEYRTIWDDFVNQACADDTLDERLAQRCRSWAETRWFRLAVQAPEHQGVPLPTP